MIEFLKYGSNLSPLFPLIMGILALGKGSSRIILFALLLIVNSMLADWISLIVALIHESNYFVINTYLLFDIILLFFFYREILRSKVPSFLYLLLFGYFIMTTFFSFNVFQSSYFSIHALANILISFIFFFELYRYESTMLIERTPQFWFVVGLLVFYSGSFFSILLSKEILNSPLPWSFTHIANILKNILFAFGFISFIKYQQPK